MGAAKGIIFLSALAAVSCTSGNNSNNTGQTDSGGPKKSSLPAPAGVTVGAGEGKITISWDEVKGATSYSVYWQATPGPDKTVCTKETKIYSTSYEHDHLLVGLTYHYGVTAIDDEGGETDESQEVSATPIGDWGIQTLDTSAKDVGLHNKIAIDSKDQLHIAYSDPENGALKYATNASGTGIVSASDLTQR